MGQRGYAVAFFLVLLAACAGAFLGGRLLFQRVTGASENAAWVPPGSPVPEIAAATDVPAVSPTSPPPAANTQVLRTPTRLVLTPFVPPTPTLEPMPTQAPATPTPYVTPTPYLSPTPTSVYGFVLAQPVRNSSGDCSGNLLLGRVTDRAGNPLPDVRIRLTDEYNAVDDTKATKSGTEAGQYDFPLFGPGRKFFLQVVDGSGSPLSERVEVEHGVGANAKASCHFVDWQLR